MKKIINTNKKYSFLVGYYNNDFRPEYKTETVKADDAKEAADFIFENREISFNKVDIIERHENKALNAFLVYCNLFSSFVLLVLSFAFMYWQIKKNVGLFMPAISVVMVIISFWLFSRNIKALK